MQHKSIITPLVTPLTNKGQVCKKSVDLLIRQLDHYVAGVVPCLTSGEGWLLSEDQWRDMLLATIDVIGPDKVIAGIEKPTTSQVLEYAAFARKIGIKTIMVTAPFGSEVTQEEILEHYRVISEESGLDIFIYNENALSGNVTEFHTLLSIARYSKVVAIKDSPERKRTKGEVEQLQHVGLRYYIGWEEDLFTEIPSNGNIVSLSNLEPILCHAAVQFTPYDLSPLIKECIKDYELDHEEWFSKVKSILYKRGLIESPRVVSL